MITLGTIAGGVSLSMGGSKAQKTQGPPINAQSPDEESFIKYVDQSESYGAGSQIRMSKEVERLGLDCFSCEGALLTCI